MSPAPDPPFDPQQQGISLDELTDAFAQVMGTAPRQPPADSLTCELAAAGEVQALESSAMQHPAAEAASVEAVSVDEACPISPRTILEAMLFVGNRDNRPLNPRRAAELMRDVDEEDILALVDDLNQRYEAAGAVYTIVSEGDGFRLTLREEMNPLRDRFYGRVREARLSQAAVDVLALVAYEQPITGEKISQLRGKPSSHVVSHLVRRGLLRLERPDPKKRTPHYYTTDRFLKLFNLESLDDLPRDDASLP